MFAKLGQLGNQIQKDFKIIPIMFHDVTKKNKLVSMIK